MTTRHRADGAHVRRLRVRQLVWLVVAISTLVIALTAWSQLRLRAVRMELEALASETAELGARNELLQRELASDLEVRAALRKDGDAVRLKPLERSSEATATIFLDPEGQRALVSVDGLPNENPGEPCSVSLSSLAIDRSFPLDVDQEGNAELLLQDLPGAVEGLQVSCGAETILSAEGPLLPSDD